MRRELRCFRYTCDGATANGMACTSDRFIHAGDAEEADQALIDERWTWTLSRSGWRWLCPGVHRED